MTSMVSPGATMIAVPPSQLQGLEGLGLEELGLEGLGPEGLGLAGFRGAAEPVISGGTGGAG